MAAPASMTTLDLSGRWIMNKTLSDTTDEVLIQVCSPRPLPPHPAPPH